MFKRFFSSSASKPTPTNIKLYMNIFSPPSRAVMMVAAELGIKLDYVVIDLLKQEQRSKEYLKINPQHSVPTLDDNGFIVWDSHAIGGYLVSRYATDDRLYPLEPKKRALIDQRMHFDSSIIFNRIRHLVIPVLFMGRKTLNPQAVADMIEAYDFLEAFLAKDPWLAGDEMCLADLCASPSVATIVELIPAPKEKYSNINAWLERCRALPYFQEINQTGIEMLKDIVTAILETPNSNL